MLSVGTYHVVVANPPYITVKDIHWPQKDSGWRGPYCAIG